MFFQVLQQTALFVRGPVTSGDGFNSNLERLTICEEKVRRALLCMQDFARSPHFTQQDFFSHSGGAMLAESAAICDSITSCPVFELWSHVETASCLSSGCGWSFCVRELGCGPTEGSQGFTRIMVCGTWHHAILRRFRVSIWCKELQYCGGGPSWIRSCECALS